MPIVDSMGILRVYLAANAGIISHVGARIHCPRLPENAVLPAIGFFRRSGDSTPYIPPLVTPSVQFDCWADNEIESHAVYGAVYDALQGVQNIPVTFGGKVYYIKHGEEEVGPQDIPDDAMPNYFRTLVFFRIMMTVDV